MRLLSNSTPLPERTMGIKKGCFIWACCCSRCVARATSLAPGVRSRWRGEERRERTRRKGAKTSNTHGEEPRPFFS